MPETLFTKAYWSADGSNDGTQPSCASGYLSRDRFGNSGNRYHGCVHHSSTKVHYDASGTTGNPCTNIGSTEWVGGGKNGDGNQVDFTGRSRNFENAPAALKCINVNITGPNLVAWSNDRRMLGAGAKDNNGTFKNFYTQALFGISTDAGQSIGFCTNIANLNVQVHSDGKTCYDMLDAAVRNTQGQQYCNIEANKTDPKCKCINVSGSGFAERCKSNPSWSGCDEINTAAAGYESVGVLQTLTGLTGGADCLVPGICSGSVYTPIETPQACANQIAICDQVQKIDVGKLEEAAQLRAFQSCNINFSGPPGTSPTSPTSPIVSLLPPSVSTFIPVSLNDLQTDRNKQYGAGGISFVSFASMCVIVIIIVVLSSGGGGGPSGPTRFRRR